MIAQTLLCTVSLAPELSLKPGSGRAEVGQGGVVNAGRRGTAAQEGLPGPPG